MDCSTLTLIELGPLTFSWSAVTLFLHLFTKWLLNWKKINHNSGSLAKDLEKSAKLFKLLFFLLILWNSEWNLKYGTSGFTVVNRFTVFFKRFIANCQIEFLWDCIGQKCAQKDGKEKVWKRTARVEICMCKTSFTTRHRVLTHFLSMLTKLSLTVSLLLQDNIEAGKFRGRCGLGIRGWPAYRQTWLSSLCQSRNT